eukprot:g732.t1
MTTPTSVQSSVCECEPCAMGTFNNGLGTLCNACPAGKASTKKGATFCEDCEGCKGAGYAVLNPTQQTFSDFDHVNMQSDDATEEESRLVESIGQLVAAGASGLGLIVLLMHRNIPERILAADIFAMNHIIKEGHAPRLFKTKLGTGMTIFFALSAVGVSIMYMLGDNLLVSSSLHPYSASALGVLDDRIKEKGFGNLEVRMEMLWKGPRALLLPACEDVSLATEHDENMDGVTIARESAASTCAITLSSPTFSYLGSRGVIEIRMHPDFYRMRIVSESSFGDQEAIEVILEAPAGELFVDGEDDPAIVLDFSTMRNYIEDKRQNTIQRGRTQRLARQTLNSDTQVSAGSRRITARLQYTDTDLYAVKTYEDRVNLVVRVSGLLSMIVSLRGIFAVATSYLETCVDKIVSRGGKIPEDVQRRQSTLDEKFITKGKRLSSMVRKSVDVEMATLGHVTDNPMKSSGVSRKEYNSLKKRLEALEKEIRKSAQSQPTAWRKRTSTEHDGAEYYYNEQTGAVQWEPPAGVNDIIEDD